MADELPVTGTNDEPQKTQDVTCDCCLLWSLAQQFSYLRLCDKIEGNQYQLIGLYAARARRIAATYARFYLETEDGGDTSKIGRYYWMALGAFASKTVSCLLDSFQVQSSYFVSKATFNTTDMREIANGLGRGNLWLFSDIAPPHWFYNHYPEHFLEGMTCLPQREVNKLIKPVKDTIDSLPWAAESLGPINQFKMSGDIKLGFEFVPQIEAARGKTKRKLQMDHLLAIANHEQGAILQPLIYEDPVFKKWVVRERKYWRWAAPKYQLVFTHTCNDNRDELKSIAPADMEVEDFDSRMSWIEDAANLFHKLMKDKATHMITELTTMASWVNSPDAEWVY